jgi:short-subunit dehydrogenase
MLAREECSFSAVYNGTKAFINSFSFALRNVLKDTGVRGACLMPVATETEFFERAGEMDTEVGAQEKDDPADMARDGFDRPGGNGQRNKAGCQVECLSPCR